MSETINNYTVRKVPKYLENPFDDLFLNTADFSVDLLYKLGFTPNGVTTLSLLFGVFCIIEFRRSRYISSSIMYLISYYFDCLDGHLARKYNMVTEFGDYYDHIKDYIIGGIVFYHLFYEYFNLDTNWKYLIILLPIFAISSVVHFGCQEVYYQYSTPLMDSLRGVCIVQTKEEAVEVMKYTRFFGIGSLTIVICALIALLFVFKNNNIKVQT